MNHAQLAHTWAQQRKTRGKGSRMFFEGTEIYSHGFHWVIARFVTNKRGQRAVLLNRNSRSQSTGQHTRHVERALSGLPIPVFRVYDPKIQTAEGHIRQARAMLKTAAELAGTAKRSRSEYKKKYREEDALAMWEHARNYARFFGVLSKLPRTDISGTLARLEVLKKAEAKREREAIERKRKEDAEEFAKWRNGETTYCPQSYAEDQHGSAYLRLRGDMVETSRGAQVPREHVEQALRVVFIVRRTGLPWTRGAENGEVRIGNFRIDRIEATGAVRAGCHFFTFERIAELAKLLGIEVQS